MRMWRLPLRVLLCLAALSLAAGPRPSAANPEGGEVESCIACHRNPDFLVTQPRLYHYYRDWERSLHHDQGVTCSDCHGGEPDAAEKKEAHRGMLGESEAGSSVNFANVPDTCGTCHDEVEAAYRKSAHFEHLKAGKGKRKEEGESRQGPSCITCHDSMNTLTLDVTTIEQTCSICHNAESGNHPEIPDEARETMRRFLSIDRFHRYVAIRLEPEEAKTYLSGIDARREELSVLWHTFDLDRIERETRAILDDLRAKRQEIRSRGQTKDTRREEGDSGSTPR